MDRRTGKTIAWVFGSRDATTFQRLYDKLKQLTDGIFYTDNWDAVAQVLPQERHVKLAGISPDDWLEYASAALLAEIHADCLTSLLCTGSADVATTLLSHVGGTLVIRVVLNALRLAHRRTVDPAVLEEAISTLCLLSHRRYEGRIPELAVCFSPSRQRPDRKAPAVYFGREFLASKKSAVLLKGGTLLLHCLSNGRVVEVVDLDFASSGPVSERVLGPIDQFSTLNYSYHHAAVTAMLTRQGEVLVAMGARICFSWDAASWHMYPAMRLSNQLCAELTRICTGKALPRHLARHITTIALTLHDDRLGAVTELVPVSQALAAQASEQAQQAGLAAMVALHVAAARAGGAAEFITVERPGKPLFRAWKG